MPLYPTHTLKVDGRPYTLYKRSTTRDAPWYLRLTLEGRRQTLCLRTNLLDSTPDSLGAEAKARAAIREATQGRWSAFISAIRPQRPRSTVADLIRIYLASAVEASPKSRKQNSQALLQFFRTQPSTINHQPSTITTDQINGALAASWFTGDTPEPSQRAAASHKRTRNSRAVQVRSLFTPRALLAYKHAAIELPHLADFLLGLKAHRYKVPRTDYHPPADTIITATLAGWPRLDRDEFLAIGLALAFGLRLGEVLQARWDWLTVISGQPFLDAKAQVKNRTGEIRVAALDPYYTTLVTRARAQEWITAPHDPILSTINHQSTFRSISAWLRGLGWETIKTIHALRAYAGSQVAMRFGIWQASNWLRHSSVQVTEAHYLSFVTAHQVITPESVGVDWAKVSAEFTPKIIEA
jgi:integrase